MGLYLLKSPLIRLMMSHSSRKKIHHNLTRIKYSSKEQINLCSTPTQLAWGLKQQKVMLAVTLHTSLNTMTSFMILLIHKHLSCNKVRIWRTNLPKKPSLPSCPVIYHRNSRCESPVSQANRTCNCIPIRKANLMKLSKILQKIFRI